MKKKITAQKKKLDLISNKFKEIKNLAITDHLNVFAAIKFYQKCIDNNGEITKFSKQWLKFKK